MPPAVAVYVAVAVVGVAAVFAFKEFVYEPHIAPALEEWAENFLERRRARRNRGASQVPVSSRRRRRHSNSSSTLSSNGGPPAKRGPGAGRGQGSSHAEETGTFELDNLVAREVDQWRNEVLRSQGMTGEGQGGLRRRHVAGDERLGMFDGMSTSLDESFPSMTHTPLAPTHVISNVSSPITATATATAAHTPSSLNLPLIPTPISPDRTERNNGEGETRPRSDSQSTATLGETVSPHPLSPILSSTISFFPVTPPDTRSPTHPGKTKDDDDALAAHAAMGQGSGVHTPVSIPTPSGSATRRNFLPRTPEGDDSPFGPILPEVATPSADRPFSPIGRVMGGLGSSAFSFSTMGDVNDTRSLRSSEETRRSSSFVEEISARLGPGSGVNEPDTREHRHRDEARDEAGTAGSRSPLDHGHDSQGPSQVEAERHTSGLEDSHGNGHGYGIGHVSIISSLSERYPIPPSPPVILSPPTSSSSTSHAIISPPLSASSHEVISAPASPSFSAWTRSSDGVMSIPSSRPASPRSGPHGGLFSSLSTLQVPNARTYTGSRSRSRSRSHSPGDAGLSPSHESSPTPSFASFLSPISPARAVSESEAAEAEFMSFVDSDEEEADGVPRGGSAAPARGQSPSMTTVVTAPDISSGARQAPVHDRAYNPFLDFEEVMEDDGSEESSDESDEEESDTSHESEGSRDGSWGSHGSARWH